MQRANTVAWMLQAGSIEPSHILLGILSDTHSPAAVQFSWRCPDTQALASALLQQLRPSGVEGGFADVAKRVARERFELSSDSARVLELAIEASRELHCDYVGTEHLLLGVLRLGSPALNTFFSQESVNVGQLIADICNPAKLDGFELPTIVAASLLRDLSGWFRRYTEPQQVYSELELGKWAERAGYVRASETGSANAATQNSPAG